MNLFRSEEHVQRWLGDRAPGATLPVTVLTLGLFLFVINAITFWAAAAVLDGFVVRNFVAALVGSLLYTVVGVVIESALERLFTKK